MLSSEFPSFIIPVGTQVVLKADSRVPGTDAVKPAGAVAEVVESPANNQRPYLLRFVDGTTLRAKFGELAVRRHARDETATPGADMRPFVIYRVTVGSQAFGLATDSSDEDRRGVYLPPADVHWALDKPPEQIESKAGGVEEVDWELEKFLRLALQANPNILETLWSPRLLYADETGRELRDLRGAFLSRRVYQTYSGYVLSQFRLMRRKHEKTGGFKPKHAMHLIRLLHSGIHALRDGDIRVDVGEHRDELLAIRGGGLPFEDVLRRALELDREFQSAFAGTKLPERPDYDRANRFLLAARRRMVR
jgi:hypothetical protein